MITIVCVGEHGIPNGEYMTVDEFARRCNVKRNRVETWITRGQIASVSYRGHRYIPVGVTHWVDYKNGALVQIRD